MKLLKKLVLVALSLSSLFSFAAPPEFYQEVLKTKSLENLDVMSITHTNSYFCNGCFDFEVVIRKSDDSEVTKTFMTQKKLGSNSIVVKEK